jgi:hypothetical protein
MEGGMPVARTLRFWVANKKHSQAPSPSQGTGGDLYLSFHCTFTFQLTPERMLKFLSML